MSIIPSSIIPSSIIPSAPPFPHDFHVSIENPNSDPYAQETAIDRKSNEILLTLKRLDELSSNRYLAVETQNAKRSWGVLGLISPKVDTVTPLIEASETFRGLCDQIQLVQDLYGRYTQENGIRMFGFEDKLRTIMERFRRHNDRLKKAFTVLHDNPYGPVWPRFWMYNYWMNIHEKIPTDETIGKFSHEYDNFWQQRELFEIRSERHRQVSFWNRFVQTLFHRVLQGTGDLLQAAGDRGIQIIENGVEAAEQQYRDMIDYTDEVRIQGWTTQGVLGGLTALVVNTVAVAALVSFGSAQFLYAAAGMVSDLGFQAVVGSCHLLELANGVPLPGDESVNEKSTLIEQQARRIVRSHVLKGLAFTALPLGVTYAIQYGLVQMGKQLQAIQLRGEQ